MATIDRVTYIPEATGGRLQSSLHVGEQELSSTWPMNGENSAIGDLLKQLMVTVQEVTFVSTTGTCEVQVMLQIGGHRYMATFPVEGSSADLKPVLDRLMDEVTKEWVNGLQTLLAESTVRERVPVGRP
jgi:hypothetical protein